MGYSDSLSPCRYQTTFHVMKKLPTFSLVRKPVGSSDRAATTGEMITKKNRSSTPSVSRISSMNTRKTALSPSIKMANELRDEAIGKSLSSPELLKVFESLDQNFKRALVSSFVSTPLTTKGNSNNPVPMVSKSVASITKELARKDEVCRVGVLDR